MIRVINCRGLNKPEQRTGIVYCGRPFAGWKGHPLANPFKPEPLGAGGACQQSTEARRQKYLADCLARYKDWLISRRTFDADLAALWEETQHGALPLGCWCTNATAGDGSPLVCHAQILAEMLRERFDREPTEGP